MRGQGKEIARRWRQFLHQRHVDKHRGKAFPYRNLGFLAVCHPDWQDSLEIYLDLAGDHAEMAFCRNWLAPGESCLDLGANVGLYTFSFAEKVGWQGEVLSVDADSFITKKMEEAACLLARKQIHPIHAAVSARDGNLSFYLSSEKRKTFEQSLVRPVSDAESYHEVTVPGLAFPSLISQLQHPERLSLIKMDIEGAEAAALSAVPKSLLDLDGPLWLVEINPGMLKQFGASPRDVTEKFPKESFDRWLLPKHPHQDSEGGTAPRRLSADEKFDHSIYYNLICIPRGRRWIPRSENVVRELEAHAAGK